MQVCQPLLYQQLTSAADAGPLATRAEPNTVANKVANNMPDCFIVLSFSTHSTARGARTIRAPSPSLSETSAAGGCAAFGGHHLRGSVAVPAGCPSNRTARRTAGHPVSCFLH